MNVEAEIVRCDEAVCKREFYTYSVASIVRDIIIDDGGIAEIHNCFCGADSIFIVEMKKAGRKFKTLRSALLDSMILLR